MLVIIGVLGIIIGLIVLTFMLYQNKINLKFICKFGIHVMPELEDLDCKSDYFTCKRCGKRQAL